MDLLEIFRRLKILTSVKDKENLLRENKDNDYLCELLSTNLNPYRMLYIKDIPEYVVNPIGLQGKANYTAFVKMTQRLNQRKVTGNAAKEEVRHFFMNSHAEEAGLYESILSKAAIGVGASTVNKVWPDLIPEFKLMLAPNKLPVITQVKYPIFIQPKLDGFRCIYRDGSMWSRTGKPFENKNLALHFKSLFGTTNYVLDGELYAHGTAFQNLTKTLTTEDAPIPATLKYIVYDCLHVTEWDNQICKKPYEERIKTLRKVLNNQIADFKKVIDIPNDLVQTSKEAIDIYKKYLQDGYEGAMLKAPDGLYQWKRTTIKSGEMLKLKPFKSVDLIVTGVYDGEGDFEGKAGGVTVDYNGITVRVGSGWDIATREAIAENPNSYIGKAIEVKYFEETEDGSLRFPIFQRFREEKD